MKLSKGNAFSVHLQFLFQCRYYQIDQSQSLFFELANTYKRTDQNETTITNTLHQVMYFLCQIFLQQPKTMWWHISN